MNLGFNLLMLYQQLFPFNGISDREMQSLFCDYNKLPYSDYCNTIFQLDEYNDFIPGEIVDLMGVSTNNCDYYETDEFIEWSRNVSTVGNYFIALFMNIRSLTKNLPEFINEFVGEHANYDILAFSETRLTKELINLHMLPGYDLFVCNRNSKGGGVAMYIRDRYAPSVLDQFSIMENCFESVFAIANIGSEKYIFGCIYRPPKSCIMAFLQKLDNVLHEIKLTFKNAKIVLQGDFNINLLACGISNLWFRISVFDVLLQFDTCHTPTNQSRSIFCYVNRSYFY